MHIKVIDRYWIEILQAVYIRLDTQNDGFSSQTAGGAVLWHCIWCQLEQTAEQIVEHRVIWDVLTLVWRHCNGNLPSCNVHYMTLRPRQNGRHYADDIFKCIFLNESVWIPIKISLKFVPKVPINNIPALVQIMAWHRPGVYLYTNTRWGSRWGTWMSCFFVTKNVYTPCCERLLVLLFSVTVLHDTHLNFQWHKCDEIFSSQWFRVWYIIR